MKSYKKIEVEEIKSYKCSDGKVFNTKPEAEEHEIELNNPKYKTEKRIKELERKVLELEDENATLSARITALEVKNIYQWPRPNPDIYPQPLSPYQPLTYNPSIPTSKLPAQPSDTVYDATQISKMSDEELREKGYSVVYCGDKRAVYPPITQFDFDNIKTNEATTPDSID